SSPPSCSSHPLCAHLHLHSFPTRRSSDLDLHIAEILRPTAPLTALLLPRACGVGTCPWASDRPCTGRTITWERNHRRAFGNHGRSEEHTSELQSPYDLVCRLLLETKNKNT